MTIDYSLRRDDPYLLAYGGSQTWPSVVMTLRQSGEPGFGYPSQYSPFYFQRVNLSSIFRSRFRRVFARNPYSFKLTEIKEPISSQREAIKRFKDYQRKAKKVKHGRKQQKRNRRAPASRKRH